MILYHGSYTEISQPRLLPFQRALDFGCGFYTTSDLEQAIWWANKTMNRRETGKPTVSIYQVEQDGFTILNMLRFDGPNAEWLRFVTSCRKKSIKSCSWDVIYGPVADDKTSETIDLYLSGLYDEKYAIQRLQPQKLKNQYVFKTERAIHILHFLESKAV